MTDQTITHPEHDEYVTSGDITVRRRSRPLVYETAISDAVEKIDAHRGAVFSSNYEYPGRYTRWDTAIVDPPLEIEGRGRTMRLSALNDRGVPLLAMIADALKDEPAIASREGDDRQLRLGIKAPEPGFDEEQRTRVPSVFSVLRAIVAAFYAPGEGRLGLFGAFGYDLTFQFDPIELKLNRPDTDRDLLLYLPDEIIVVDHHQKTAEAIGFDFVKAELSTVGLNGKVVPEPFKPAPAGTHPGRGDHQPGEYARLVDHAKRSFARGDLFEVVPGQTFFEKVKSSPAAISRRLKEINPSPYSFFINLGAQEYLVGASPEMFVRVDGRRIETCPISGTIRRGKDAIEDSEQILKLLNSKKDESELTMCSDVDRNDKSRVCEPGSVRVIGRRQIEMYSRLIHTVDHIEGRLRDGMDAFDGFLTHTWAVTVTGAPKLWAMRFIENQEKSPRVWYGGAVGMVGFDGNMNTGLTLRTIRIKDGIAQVRAGATLLHDSVPEDEEAETELKASALLTAIRESGKPNVESAVRQAAKVGAGKRILLVDHEDSFVHTLANYFRRTGAEVRTVRSPVPDELLASMKPDLVVMSPGPGSPSDFNCATTIDRVRAQGVPLFGVCLGLQAITEALGGELQQLDVPMHGKPSRIQLAEDGGIVFSGLGGDERQVTVGRYHSLHADPQTLPNGLRITARTDDGVIMGIQHVDEPIAAVQFHPESIMSLGADAGMRMIENVVAHLAGAPG
ncbi:MAG: anthranilate synthase component I [Pseudomonadota bacterium]